MKRFFKAIWAGWKRFAHRLGVFNTKVLLTIMYFIIVGIVSVIARIFQRDMLGKRFDITDALWCEREAVKPDLAEAKRQF